MSRNRATQNKSKSSESKSLKDIIGDLENRIEESEEEDETAREDDVDMIYNRICIEADSQLQSVEHDIISKRKQQDRDMFESIKQQYGHLYGVKNELFPTFAAAISRLKKVREDIHNGLETLESDLEAAKSSGASMTRDLDKCRKQEVDALKNEVMSLLSNYFTGLTIRLTLISSLILNRIRPTRQRTFHTRRRRGLPSSSNKHGQKENAE